MTNHYPQGEEPTEESITKTLTEAARALEGAAERLESSQAGLDTDLRVALLHYSPVEETLRGERLEIFPFLGSYLLAEAIDRAGADVVFHGHAHAGSEKGVTPGGVRVRNVAQPVLRRPYTVYKLSAHSHSGA